MDILWNHTISKIEKRELNDDTSNNKNNA